MRLTPQSDGRGGEEAGGGKREAGLGEAAPISWFGTETVDEIEAACREIGEWVEEAQLLERVPVRLGCLRHAIAAARRDVSGEARAVAEEGAKALGVAALLPAGRTALPQIGPKADSGFRVFKWKVGVADIADELALLDDLCAALPTGAKLRLDANGAWDRRKAERWLERCAERPVEFVEQPVAADAKGAADVLLGLAGDWPTPLALDESLVGDGDVERWIGAGWPGVFVVKPALLGDVAGALVRLEKARAEIVFSSALETAVGARAALRWAFAWEAVRATARQPATKREDQETEIKETGPESRKAAGRVEERVGSPRALGFGVWPLFTDARFDGPIAAPFIRAQDVERIDVEAVWNALS